MIELDSVQIGVAEIEEAARAYEVLLGVAPRRLPSGACRFHLGTGAVELEGGVLGVHSIAFVARIDDPAREAARDGFHGLTVRLDAPRATPSAQAPAPAPRSAETPGVLAIDHIVVRTAAPERAIALWRDRYGLRLALDREFPARALRLLFFRSAGITLEYASPLPPPAEATPDGLYGISYRVADLRRWHARLAGAGIDVSEIRSGMRPGTSVVTVRSGTAGVPTLLLGGAVAPSE